MTWQLVVEQGCRKGLAITIHKSSFLIGRDPSCQLRPSSPFICDRHCELKVRHERLYIVNGSPTSITQVNDRPIETECELQPGDRITVGPLSFVINGPSLPRRVAPSEKSLGEEAICDMLLSMEDSDDRKTIANSPSSETVFEQAVLAQADTVMEQSPAKKATSTTAKPISATDTSDAASEILRNYRRRPK